MGWCHEFGPQVRPGCDHPMVAAGDECHCVACGARCEGRFKGCDAVWSRGPRVVAVMASAPPARPAVAPSTEEQPPLAPPPATPTASTRTGDDVLHGVTSALEAVSAELRAMRNAVAAVHDAVAAPPGERPPPASRVEPPPIGQDPPDRGSTFH